VEQTLNAISDVAARTPSGPSGRSWHWKEPPLPSPRPSWKHWPRERQEHTRPRKPRHRWDGCQRGPQRCPEGANSAECTGRKVSLGPTFFGLIRLARALQHPFRGAPLLRGDEHRLQSPQLRHQDRLPQRTGRSPAEQGPKGRGANRTAARN
jgi:hypothetical protein